MSKTQGDKRYDLEDRTYVFARDVREFVKGLPRTVCNTQDVKQVVRSSGSVGANYLEANEALGKKDFRMRIRISHLFSISIFGFRISHSAVILPAGRSGRPLAKAALASRKAISKASGPSS